MVILNIALMALTGTAMVALLTWSICTQWRHAGYADIRTGRRLQIRLVTLEEPRFAV
jgi:hypothetical protein